MTVILADIDAQKLGEAAESLIAAGIAEDRVSPICCDVADRASVADLADEVVGRFGQPAVLMNNAATGLNPGKPWENAADWDALLRVNLGGVINGVLAFGPAMVASGQPGLIINTGSKQGITRPPGNAAYNVAKAGVLAYTEMLAHALRNEEGCEISAHLLVPGFTYTGLIRRFVDEKPAAAWTAEQVADFMLESIARDEFYILCPDNDVDRATDAKRIAWTIGDIIENRPALSRWHADYEAAFDAFMASDAGPS
jgi:NAD(P)-dependent dehydrogenase (short-subunit alcohol dehydrogenase family)